MPIHHRQAMLLDQRLWNSRYFGTVSDQAQLDWRQVPHIVLIESMQIVVRQAHLYLLRSGLRILQPSKLLAKLPSLCYSVEDCKNV